MAPSTTAPATLAAAGGGDLKFAVHAGDLRDVLEGRARARRRPRDHVALAGHAPLRGQHVGRDGAHVLAAERGVPGERYVISGATLSAREALELVTEISGARRDVRILPPAAARVAGAVVEGAFRLRGRTPPVCREMVRTLLHGHRYDGGKATRELGLVYTPVAETFRRTIEWARAEGLVRAGA